MNATFPFNFAFAKSDASQRRGEWREARKSDELAYALRSLSEMQNLKKKEKKKKGFQLLLRDKRADVLWNSSGVIKKEGQILNIYTLECD